MNQYVEAAKQAAQIAGRILLGHRGKVQAREKRPDDLVTQADLESQEAIRGFLLKAFPDHGFRGEEGEFSNTTLMPEWTWIVDPLDGTANFVHGLSGFAVSIALTHQGTPIAGAVFDPVSEEMFFAAKDQGAWLGAKRLRVSNCVEIRKAMICVSLPPRLERTAPEITCLTEVLLAARGVRRLGSAALNLAYVADGRLDGYWATSIYPWDIAAGVLLVREAGGTITGLHGEPYSILSQKIVTSATEPLHRQLLATVGAMK
jgi:myo-inositol-1(or 4)-monophosphatase